MIECVEGTEERLEEEMREIDTETQVQGEGATRVPTLSVDETARLGKEIYERDIRHQVEKDHVGKICAIDVDSGIWALGDEETLPGEIDPVDRIRQQRPEAVNIWLERVGYWTLTSFGGAPIRRTD